MTVAPIFVRSGNDFEVVYPDLELRFRMYSVNETATGRLSGELLVTSTRVELADAELAWEHMELSSTTARDRVAKALSDCYQGTGPDFKVLMLEICRGIARRFREGAPIEVVTNAQQRHEDRYLLRPLILRNEINGIYADGDTGKGWIVIAVMVELLTLKLPLGMSGQAVKRVLYVDYETSRPEIEDRVARMCLGHGITPPEFEYHRASLSIGQEVGLIRRRMQPYDIVFWDSMGAGMGEKPNDPGVAASAMNALRQLDTTVLFIDHVNKGGGMVGSVYKRNLCRSLWEAVKRKGDPGDTMHLTLWHRKGNNTGHRPAKALRFTFQGEEGPVHVESDMPYVASTDGDSHIGRRRRYESSAERQRAYRARKLGESTGDDATDDDD